MIPKTGDTLPPVQIAEVDTAAMKEWAVFLRDPNPIHLDPEIVKAKGLGDKVINQGPINVAYMINMLNAAYPTGTIESLDTRFLDNVYGGEAVVAFGTVTAVCQRDGATIVSCDIGLRVEGRKLAISGTATVKLCDV